jgi:hypothetical protein
LIDAESGDTIESCLELPNLPKPQDLGSCISYYRRYTLASLMGLQATDDDGNNLNPKPVEKVKITKEAYQTAVKMLGEKKVTLEQVKAKYILSEDQEDTLSKI